MNFGIVECIVVYNWVSVVRICGEMSFLNVGCYSDDYIFFYYYFDFSVSIKNVMLVIIVVEN